jgi:hypothetical protein
VLAGSHGPAQRRAWLLALAAGTRRLASADPVTPAQLAGWAADPGLAPLDRCLALAGLGRVDRTHAALRDRAIAAAAADRDPAMRACAATATRTSSILAGLLRDPSPRVRALAGFTVAACPVGRERDTAAELARLALADPHPGVARAAAAALVRPHPGEPCRWQLVDAGEAGPGDEAGPGWVDLEWREQTLRLPALPLGAHRWLLLPTSEPVTPRHLAPASARTAP